MFTGARKKTKNGLAAGCSYCTVNLRIFLQCGLSAKNDKSADSAIQVGSSASSSRSTLLALQPKNFQYDMIWVKHFRPELCCRFRRFRDELTCVVHERCIKCEQDEGMNDT